MPKPSFSIWLLLTQNGSRKVSCCFIVVVNSIETFILCENYRYLIVQTEKKLNVSPSLMVIKSKIQLVKELLAPLGSFQLRQ